MKVVVKPRARRRAQRGFTLIELLIVIAIIAILAAILFPVFARARENARRSACQSNMKQIGLGIIQYTQDYDERYPSVWDGQSNDISLGQLKYWPYAIFPYVKSVQVFRCPSEASTTNAGSYLMNSFLGLQNSAVVAESSTAVMASEGNAGNSANKSASNAVTGNGLNEDYSLYCQPYRLANAASDHKTPRHFSRDNFLYADGHVKTSPQMESSGVPSVAEMESFIPFDKYIRVAGSTYTGCSTGWQ